MSTTTTRGVRGAAEGAVTVMLACAEPLLCEALGAALSARPPLRVLDWSASEAGAAAAAHALRPAVVVASLELADGSGLGLASRLRGVSPAVLLTRRHEGEILFDALDAGAMGCVHHDSGVDELADLVVHAAAGGFALAPGRLHEVLVRAAATRERTQRASRAATLTGREREVLALLARGLDNPAIARRLYLSTQTVRTHVRNILRKLAVHSRAEAARAALSDGIVETGVAVLHLEGPELSPP